MARHDTLAAVDLGSNSFHMIVAHPQADTFVDITDHIDLKIEALLCHESQHPDPEQMQTRVRAWGAMNAEQFGLGPGRLAESFQVIDTR